jgi:hypothetical protein
MFQTELLKSLLAQANAIKDQYGSACLWASHIAAAAVDYCKSDYTGICISDINYRGITYEEERLRWILAKEVKLSAYFRLRLSRNAKAGITETPFDFSGCEAIAASRGVDALSADVAVLCAFSQLHESYKGAVRTVTTESAVLSCLQELDLGIYDYVIASLHGICAKLEKKATQAAALRDWKPAPKFAEPEELYARFFAGIEKTTSGNCITLKLPDFFGGTDLKLSIHQVNNCYYIHDNGCALRHLAKHLPDESKLDRVLKKVCHARRIHGKRITGRFAAGYTLLHYLQMLVFIAHADLYYTRAKRQLYPADKGVVYIDAKHAQPLDEEALLAEMKKAIGFYYSEDLGLCCWLDTKYSTFSHCAAFLIETLDDGQIRISDKRKGNTEGGFWEAFYWDNTDISPYSPHITQIAQRFKAEFENGNLFLTTKQQKLLPALFHFFNLAILFSEFGHDIALPRLGIRRKLHD